MIDINEWLKVFAERAEQTFSDRIIFIGLQGSQARGEANDTSDIDVVVIFDKFTADDLRRYRLMLDTLPEREKICGFVSGRDEIMNWDTSDLFQFCHDTLPIKGNLDELFALIDSDSVKRAIKTGVCNIYHACVHNFLHERDVQILRDLYKSVRFVIKAEHFIRTGRYLRTNRELYDAATHAERCMLVPETTDFDELSQNLFIWAGQKIRKEEGMKNIET